MLLHHRANVDQSACNFAFPLYIAAERGHVATVQLLLDHKASITKVGRRGISPLSIASQNNHTSVVQLLLAHKASVQTATSHSPRKGKRSPSNSRAPSTRALRYGATPSKCSTSEGHAFAHTSSDRKLPTSRHYVHPISPTSRPYYIHVHPPKVVCQSCTYRNDHSSVKCQVCQSTLHADDTDRYSALQHSVAVYR